MKYDIVIWGASSFVGKLVAEHLSKNASESLSIALGGRNSSKLAAVNQQYCDNKWPILVGDADDSEFLTDMAASTKLIISTVGPYALYGEPLIKACVEQGIDYCDLTGEPQWIWQMLQNYEQQAKATGARIIHCCGFDSIPSDLGVLQLQHLTHQAYGVYCDQIHYRFNKTKGGFSGGTVASMLNAIKQIRRDPKQARVLKTPYALLPEKPQNLPYQASVKTLAKDPISGCYLAPFIMASINTKIVHRTNYLLNYPWRTDFLYDEAMQYDANFNGWRKAVTLVSGLTLFGLAASFAWPRALLERYILPKPGQGPSQDVVKQGFFELELIGHVKGQRKVKLGLTGQGDPGYGSTCQMIAETACLLLGTKKNQVGFLTPAAALGLDLVERLQQRAGLSFSPLHKLSD